MALIVNELHPIADYAEMTWQALMQERDNINALQRTLDDYDLRRELLGLLQMNLQDEADVAAYRIRIRARQRRIGELMDGAL